MERRPSAGPEAGRRKPTRATRERAAAGLSSTIGNVERRSLAGSPRRERIITPLAGLIVERDTAGTRGRANSDSSERAARPRPTNPNAQPDAAHSTTRESAEENTDTASSRHAEERDTPHNYEPNRGDRYVGEMLRLGEPGEGEILLHVPAEAVHEESEDLAAETDTESTADSGRAVHSVGEDLGGSLAPDIESTVGETEPAASATETPVLTPRLMANGGEALPHFAPELTAADLTEGLPGQSVFVPRPPLQHPAEAAALYVQQTDPQLLANQMVAAPGNTGAEKTFTQKEASELARSAEQAGLGRGVATGLFFAGLEHLRHKGRERKTEKRFQQTLKEQQKIQSEKQTQLTEQANEQAKMKRKLAIAEERATTSEQQLHMHMQQQEQQNVHGQVRTGGEQQPATVRHEPVVKARMERPAITMRPEARTTVTPTGEQAAQAIPEQHRQTAAQSTSAEQLVAPKGHHIEQSAWLSRETDEHGRLVDEGQSVIAYGEEYRHERAAEQAAAGQGQAAKEGDAQASSAQSQHEVLQHQAGMGNAVGGAQSGIVRPHVPNQLPYAVPPVLSTTQPSNVPQPLTPPPVQQDARSTGPIWPYLVALGVILAAIVALLR